MARSLLILALFAAGISLPANVHAQALLDKTIGPSEFSTPITASLVDGHLIGVLARAAGVPLGIELATPGARARAEVTLTGLSVRAALDAVTTLDPRYEWRELDGVIVLRTAEAWNSVSHPLYQQVPPVLLGDIRGRNVLSFVASWLGADQYRDVWFGDSKRFTLQFTGGRMLDLLNAAVGAHGELAWTYEFRPAGGPLPCIVSLYSGSSGASVGVPGTPPAGSVDPADHLEPWRLDGRTTPPVLDRIVGTTPYGQQLKVGSPSPAYVMQLAAATRVPIGIEFVGPHPGPGGFAASGRPLREVLDAMVALNPLYEWREMKGVIVIRPAAAWHDADSLLFRQVAPLRMLDVTPAEAIERLLTELGREGVVVFPDSRPISLDLPAGTVLDLVNAILREHGELTWTLQREPDSWKPSGLTHTLMFGIMGGGGKGWGIR